jgi:hypothetical protein
VGKIGKAFIHCKGQVSCRIPLENQANDQPISITDSAQETHVMREFCTMLEPPAVEEPENDMATVHWSPVCDMSVPRMSSTLVDKGPLPDFGASNWVRTCFAGAKDNTQANILRSK